MSVDLDDLRARWDVLVGRGWQAAFAEALGVQRVSVNRAVLGKSAGPLLALLVATLELLELVPVERWPARFAPLARLATARVPA